MPLTESLLLNSFPDSGVPAPRWAKRSEAVDHPDHYQSPGGLECIDAIHAALGHAGFIAHCRGTAMKYIWRCERKGRAAEDLRKAAWYLNAAAKVLGEEGDV